MTKKAGKGVSFARKVLAVLLMVTLVVSVIASNIVWAEETLTTTNGYYDDNGEWHQGGNGVFTYKDGALTLSKTAKPVEGQTNVFEITLKVSMKQSASVFIPGSLATVLVIDVSNSMKACDECQSQTSHYSDCSKNTGFIFGSTVQSTETRLYAAKQAAIAFIDAMKEGTEEGSGRYVNIVSFGTDAINETDEWYDVTTTAGYNAVKKAISELETNGGTNLDDGLGHANDWFNDKKLSLITKGGKNVVVLSDGKPTYYMNTSGTRQGNGSDSSKPMLDDTILAANELKTKANVFTVCYNAADSSTYSGGPTVGKFLEDSIATPATEDIIYAYDASSSSELIESFMSIVEIELEGAKITITDPMPDNITIPDNGLPDGIKYQDGMWSLKDIEPKVEIDDETATYTYTIIYKVEVDPDKIDFEDDKFYPANKRTFVVLSDTERYEFPVPGIMPTPNTFDVTYNAGDHGSIEGEDENGNVTEEVIKGKPTPTPPEVTPDDGWYFVGWTPEVSDTVDGEVTYTAIYSQKQVIKVRASELESYYNGSEQTFTHYYIISGLPDGWTVSGIDYSVSGRNAGIHTGSFNGTPVVRDENGDIVPTEQYVVTFEPSTLTIHKCDLTITANSASKIYDGTALTDNGWTSSIVASGEVVSGVTVVGSQTLVGSSANVASGAVVMNGNADVTANYNITYVDGTLTVEKNLKEITIIANSATKEYDGTPLTDGGYTLDGAGIAQGDVLTVVVEGSQTTAGTSANKVVSYKVMRGNDDVTSFYSFATPIDGVLTVEKRELTITADSANKVYDGTALTDNGWKDTAPAGLADGDEIVSVSVTGSQTDVGSSANVASGAVIMRAGEDVTASYDITYIDGTLTVNKVGAAITITANSNTKIYDGLPLYDGGFTFTQGVLAEGDVLMVTVEGSIIDAGTIANKVVSYKVIRDGVDVTSFYTFAEPVDGTLTVTKRDLVITAGSATKEYDGVYLNCNDYTVEGLATTDRIDVVHFLGSQLEVGSSVNKIIGVQVVCDDEYGFPSNKSYNIVFVDGTLTVTKNTQEITITVGSATKEYDGTPLTHSSYTMDGFIAEGDELIVACGGKQTNVGSSPNKAVTIKVMRDGVDITSYYTFAQPVDGTLTVTKAEGEIIVTAGSASKEYDGTPLTSDSYTVNEDILADGEEIVVEIEGSQTFVGTSANKVVSIKVMRDGVDVTDNYNIGTPVDGVLEITGKSDEITITADSDSKEYDGTPLTNDGYTVAGELADGDELVVVIEGSQTNAGTSANKVVSIKVMRDGVDVTDNYTNLQLENGTLTVTKVDGEIIVTAGSASKEYDGTPLTSSSYTVTGDLVDGEEIVVEIEGSQTYAGSSANKVVSIKVMRDGVDVTDNYNIGTPVDGVLEVTAKANTIVITANSDTKTYDGTALVNGGYSFTQGILVEGDVLVAEVNGSQTFVGTSANEITSYKVMRGNEDVTDNYSIVTVNGTLEVTKREVVITADSASKIYNGAALTDNGWKDTAPAGLADGDTVASVVVAGSQTGVGQSANVASGAVIMRGTKDVTDCYDITYVDGTLTVSAVSTPIIITAGSASKTYDGTPLTSGSYTFTQGVLAAGDELVVVIEGSQTDAGISANRVVSYKVMRGGVDVTSYYTFATSVDGTLEITKRDITITADSATKEYDSTELTKDTFTVSGIVSGEQAQATVTGSQLFAGSSANVVSNAAIISGGKDVTANYNITFVDGVLTVEKKSDTVTITADSATKEYDGTPLTNDSYTVVGELANGDEVVVVIEGSQTFAGSSDNKVVSVKVMRDGADVTDNYANLELVDGTLTVTKKTDDITITAGSASKEYDGTPLTSDEYTITGELADGDEIVVEIEGSQTFAGTSANKVISIKVIRDGVDVTDNYENLIPEDGTLTIEKVGASITITAGSAEKIYDGSPLTSGDYTVTGELIEGDELVVVIEGSQTEVGSSANKVVSIKVMRGETDVTDCYNIELPVDGELVITPEIPDTGDHSSITIWSVMMLFSLLALAALALTSKKQRAR